MRIATLRVEGFRSLRDAVIPLSPMSVFIGPNGAGKSSALLALRLFFFPKESVGEQDFWRGTDGAKADEITIAVTFAELSEVATEAFSRFVSTDDDLTIERVFSEPGSGTYIASRLGVEEFAQIRRSPKGHRDQFNELAATGRFEGLAPARSKDEAFASMERWENENREQCVEISEEVDFLLQPAGSSDALGSYLHAVFVGALDDPESHVEARGGGAMVDLLGAAADFGAIEKDLHAIADHAGGEVARVLADHDRVFEQTKDALEKALASFAPGFAVDFAWGTPRTMQPHLPQVVVSVRGADGLATDMAHQGHGVQRSLMFGILTAHAELEMREVSRAIVVIIEEPEAFQHPLSARALSRTFQRLTSRDYQIVYSTHSPEMVTPSAIPGLRFFARGPTSDGRGFHTSVKTFSIEKMAESLETAVGGAEFTGTSMAARIEANVDSSVLVGLFAQLAVLVEGDEDEALIRGAAGTHSWDLDESGVAVIRCRGKTNIPLVLALFQEAGVPTYPIFDLDRDKRRRDWRGTVWAEDTVRRILGLDADTELSQTVVSDELSCWRENFGRVVRSEIGGTYDAQEQRVCSELGYQVKHGRKVGPVVERVLVACYSNGLRSDSLDGLIRTLQTRLARQL